jgi:hypothetical protein
MFSTDKRNRGQFGEFVESHLFEKSVAQSTVDIRLGKYKAHTHTHTSMFTINYWVVVFKDF